MSSATLYIRFTCVGQLREIVGVECYVARAVLSQHFVVGLAWERRLSSHENMADYSQAEDIADRIAFSLQVLQVDDLGGDISRGSTPYEQVLGLVCPGGQPEICDHAVIVAVLPKENVFRLEITVHHPL